VKLTGPDFFEWKGLRRAHRDHGLLKLGDPNKSGMRPVTLTDAGLAHYRVLCKHQRRKDPVVPPPRALRHHRDPGRLPVEHERSLIAASAPRLPAAGRPSPPVSPQ